jgi:sphingosine kinase
VHEVYNGMAEHKTPRKAFRIPIAPIPAGSGNGLSLNILGLKVYKLYNATGTTLRYS